MSKKIRASEKRIKKVFEQMFHKEISVEGGRMSERTVRTYTDMTLAVFRDVYREFGIENVWGIEEKHINQVIQRRIDSYHAGELKESWNLKQICSSLKSFNLGVQKTNVFKEKFVVGDPDDIRETLKEQYVIRKSGSSSVLRATPNECLSVLDKIKDSGYDTDTREIAYHAGKIGLETGGRISAILRLRAGDIAVDLDKSIITYVGDKGGLTRSIEIPKETALYLHQMKNGKKDNQYIFSSKRKDGTFKSVKETRKAVSKIYKDAGKHLNRTEPVRLRDKDGEFKLVDVNRKFSSHCFRKAFALERTGHYYSQFSSKSVIDRYVSQRIEGNPKLKEKIGEVRRRINENRNTKRDLNRSEYAIFFTSVDLGHFRNDVITAFYTTFKEVEEYIKN